MRREKKARKKEVNKIEPKKNALQKHTITLKQQFVVILIQLKCSFIVRGQLKLAWCLLCCCQIVFIKQCLAAHLAVFVRNRMSCYKVAASLIACLAATVEWLQPQINSYRLSSRLQFWPSLNSWTWASGYSVHLEKLWLHIVVCLLEE